ncbi:glycosyltransferase family 4 protein [Salinibius halmophilus]|uniref:glycosyltransferase family 4 protein n=1 Tax=Salinibius halmophilus TaxID=1853216 RepID=UPI000E663E91|nr:glycosyltransferase family 4 protein [Salinibius halmophilus]
MSTWLVNTRLDLAPEVIVSDLHHRISGVSSTCRAVTPLVAKHYRTILLSKNPLSGVTHISSFWKLVELLRQHQPERGFFIWHARRNNEMQLALFAKHVLRLPIKIVFTSAAIRRHSWWPRKLIASMDYIIATSSSAAGYVNAQAIVPHGVDLSAFSAKPKRDASLTIGVSGRVRPEKGTDILVEAMLPLLKRYPNIRLLIAGAVTPKYEMFARRLKQQLMPVQSQVAWLGELALADMPAFYQSLDVVCAPARYEGFGVVPLEAMACGTAVVASKTGAYPDLVSPEVGSLIDIGSVQQLASAIEKLIASPEKLLACKTNALNHVRKFSLDNEASGIINAYNSLFSAAPLKH